MEAPRPLAAPRRPNVHIMDTKTGTCDVVAGRRPRGPALPEFVASYRHRAGIED